MITGHHSFKKLNVVVLGAMDSRKLAEFYNALDIFVNLTFRPWGVGVDGKRLTRVNAKDRWFEDKDNSLSKGDALPLPITYPSLMPTSLEGIERRMVCNPEK
eukprot:Gb_25818 [translate_table: standard]